MITSEHGKAYSNRSDEVAHSALLSCRHFVKEDLPRIAYANPSLKIVVDKMNKKIEDDLLPVMDVEFRKSD
jgi:Mitochondrial ribosomal protein L51 / S25 / CI-B8 domain